MARRLIGARTMRLPIAALLASMLSLQFGASTATVLFGAVGAQGATTLRLVLASAMLAAVFRPWRAPIPRAAWGVLAGYGAALGCMNLMFYLSLRTIPLGIAVALEFLGPFAITLLHARRRLDLLWIALAVAGLACLLPGWSGAGQLDPRGEACALAAGAFWACYMIFGSRAGAALGTRAAALGTVIAALVVLPVGLAHAGTRLVAPGVLARGLVVALFSSALPYSLEMIALIRLPPVVFGTLTSLEPAVAALIGRALLHQTLTFRQGVAITAIIAAAAGAVITGKRKLEPA